MTYKIYKEGSYFYKNFNSLEDAQAYALSIGYNAELAAEQQQAQPKSAEQKVLEGMQFGKALYFQFVVDNQIIAENGVGTFSKELTEALIDSFFYIKESLLAGSITQAKELLLLVPTDAVIFTQTRKDGYIAQMDSFLNSL